MSQLQLEFGQLKTGSPAKLKENGEEIKLENSLFSGNLCQINVFVQEENPRYSLQVRLLVPRRGGRSRLHHRQDSAQGRIRGVYQEVRNSSFDKLIIKNPKSECFSAVGEGSYFFFRRIFCYSYPTVTWARKKPYFYALTVG